MTAVDKNGQLDPSRPAKIVQRIQRCPDCATAEKHVVHQNDRLSAYIEWDKCGPDFGGGAAIKIVPVHTDVEAACRNALPPDSLQRLAQPLCQQDAAALDPDQDDRAGHIVALGDFMSNPGERALDCAGVEDDSRRIAHEIGNNRTREQGGRSAPLDLGWVWKTVFKSVLNSLAGLL